MAVDAKQQAREAVRRAQRKVESSQDHLDWALAERRESIKQARATGLSLAEIGKVAGLHRSRVDQILRGA